jgi:hypothetical protein
LADKPPVSVVFCNEEMKRGIRNGLVAVALLAIALVVIAARALVAHGYEAHIGHPMFHFSALIAFSLGCVVGGKLNWGRIFTLHISVEES